jgi:hypothetical protein
MWVFVGVHACMYACNSQIFCCLFVWVCLCNAVLSRAPSNVIESEAFVDMCMRCDVM